MQITLPDHINTTPTCPNCKASPDESCTTASGRVRRDWHAARIQPLRLDLSSGWLYGRDPLVVPELKVTVWTSLIGGRRSVTLDARIDAARSIKLASADCPNPWQISEYRAQAQALLDLLEANDFPALWATWVTAAREEKVEQIREEAAEYGYRLVKA